MKMEESIKNKWLFYYRYNYKKPMVSHLVNGNGYRSIYFQSAFPKQMIIINNEPHKYQ